MSKRKTFEERREEELAFINHNNPDIVNPNQLVGSYLCLIYSKQHDALRKILVNIHPDMTVESLATQHYNQQTIIRYRGHIERFAEGLFQFVLTKNLSTDHMRGLFLFQSIQRPMYGSISGIFKGTPKAGRAVFVRINKELEALIDTSSPEFIPINTQRYGGLDELLELTNLFAGNFLEAGKMDSRLILNDSRARFRRLLRSKNGEYNQLSGIYAEYYFDHNKDMIRKDYILIRKDGRAYMVANNYYKGEVEMINTSQFILKFRSSMNNPVPVMYLMNFEHNDWKIHSGTFSTIKENNRGVVSNAVYLHKISDECLEKEEFFLNYSDHTLYIKPRSRQFDELNREMGNLGHQLTGKTGNYMLIDHFIEPNLTANNCRQIAYTFFYAACHLASLGKTSTDLRALKELERSFRHGFNNKKLLVQELQTGGLLSGLADMIDLEEMAVNL